MARLSTAPGLALALLLGASCHRIADEPIDFEALKLDACERSCAMFETCDPDRFVGMEPEDCMERCMTGLPFLHEENQCGSREILYLRCLGDLDCEGLAAFEIGNDYSDPPIEWELPCVTEAYYTKALCSTDEPFDLDEPTPPPPSTWP
jgi:hypothetical protein